MSAILLSRKLKLQVYALAALAISLPVFGQSRDRQAQDAETDISLLKRIVREQDRRIAELEKAIKSLQAAVSPNAEAPSTDERLVKERAGRISGSRLGLDRWRNPKP